ncbi:MAG: Holliday junction resolvase RuvX [Phaeodactylibacter sp.]|nr:Holliday junction resolvase RuvX [Phaeodactylibacter sp.]
MARILGIDYGTKRTGIATTDPLQIIVSGLETVATQEVLPFLTTYLAQEQVEKIVVGEPLHADGSPAQIAHLVVGFVRILKKTFPDIEVITWDERYTSETAKDIILQSGVGRKKRREKALVDKVSAVLILEDYMQQQVWTD